MYFLIIRRYAPFSTFGGGFEGDVRTAATTSPTATARTVGIVGFDARGVQGLVSFSSGSTFQGAGPWLAEKIGRKFSKVKAEVSHVRLGGRSKTISFSVHTSGSNPLVPIVAPDIDTYVDMRVSFGEGLDNYEGSVRGDSFPNAEVFVIDTNRRDVLLFDYRTAGGRETGPLALFGDHSDQILGTFSVNSVLIGPLPATPVTRGRYCDRDLSRGNSSRIR